MGHGFEQAGDIRADQKRPRDCGKELEAFLGTIGRATKETRIMSEMNSITQTIARLGREGWEGANTSGGVLLSPEHLIANINNCETAAKGYMSSWKQISDENVMSEADKVAANNGVPRAHGIRDAVVYCLVLDVKRARLNEQFPSGGK